MQTFQLFVVSVISLSVVLSQRQHASANNFMTRSPIQGIGKQMTDFALNKFISAVRRGGRGHHELLALTSKQQPTLRSPVHPSLITLSGVSQIGAPKAGAFYIVPPERHAPFFYYGNQGDKIPHMLKLSEVPHSSPFTKLEDSELLNQPSATQQGFQFIQMPSPSPLVFGTAPPSSFTAASSLQEIIAKAARDQHSRILEKDQAGNRFTPVATSEIPVAAQNDAAGLAPNPNIDSLPVPNGRFPIGLNSAVGAQPIFINSYGQPFLAPAIIQGSPQFPLQFPRQGTTQIRMIPVSVFPISDPSNRPIVPAPTIREGVDIEAVRSFGDEARVNAALGQYHPANVGGSGDFQMTFQNQQVDQSNFQQPEKEEQPTRPDEMASNAVTVTRIRNEADLEKNQVTAAIMQSSAEFSEPRLQN